MKVKRKAKFRITQGVAKTKFISLNSLQALNLVLTENNVTFSFKTDLILPDKRTD